MGKTEDLIITPLLDGDGNVVIRTIIAIRDEGVSVKAFGGVSWLYKIEVDQPYAPSAKKPNSLSTRLFYGEREIKILEGYSLPVTVSIGKDAQGNIRPVEVIDFTDAQRIDMETTPVGLEAETILRKKITDAHQRSSEWLAQANEASEKGDKDREQFCLDKSQFWLDRLNKLENYTDDGSMLTTVDDERERAGRESIKGLEAETVSETDLAYRGDNPAIVVGAEPTFTIGQQIITTADIPIGESSKAPAGERGTVVEIVTSTNPNCGRIIGAWLPNWGKVSAAPTSFKVDADVEGVDKDAVSEVADLQRRIDGLTFNNGALIKLNHDLGDMLNKAEETIAALEAEAQEHTAPLPTSVKLYETKWLYERVDTGEGRDKSVSRLREHLNSDWRVAFETIQSSGEYVYWWCRLERLDGLAPQPKPEKAVEVVTPPADSLMGIVQSVIENYQPDGKNILAEGA